MRIAKLLALNSLALRRRLAALPKRRVAGGVDPRLEAAVAAVHAPLAARHERSVPSRSLQRARTVVRDAPHEPLADARPVLSGDRKEHRIAYGAIISSLEAPQRSLIASPKAGNRALRPDVSHVGLELNSTHPQDRKRVIQEQKLRVRVDDGPPDGRCIQCRSDFETRIADADLEIRRSANNGTFRELSERAAQANNPDKSPLSLPLGDDLGEVVGVAGSAWDVTPDRIGVDGTKEQRDITRDHTWRQLNRAPHQAIGRRRPLYKWPRRIERARIVDGGK
jgi:hypothetical protein